MKQSTFVWIILLLGVVLVGCTGQNQTETAQEPTDTLMPLVTLTPRQTSTQVLTKTPLPSPTYTPSISPIPPTPTITPTATEIPPVMGIILSNQPVNVREGPGTEYKEFTALDAGVEVEILTLSEDQAWYNVKLGDGREGWVSTRLVRIEPSPTPFPTLVSEADLTSLAQGTPFASLNNGGTVTATTTPPAAIFLLTPPTLTPAQISVSREPVNTATSEVTTLPSPTVGTPAINTTAVFQTATALAISAGTISPPTSTGQAPLTNAPTTAATNAPPAATVPPGTPTVQEGVNVLAYCDNPAYGSPAPKDLAAGSTLDVFWSWFARTREQVQQHLNNAQYDVQINGKKLENLQPGPIRQREDGNYEVFWYIRSDALPAGQTRITFKLTWAQAITDGYAYFGPGTNTESNEGTCTFTVR